MSSSTRAKRRPPARASSSVSPSTSWKRRWLGRSVSGSRCASASSPRWCSSSRAAIVSNSLASWPSSSLRRQLDPRAEVALADRLRRGAQPIDRAEDAAREQQHHERERARGEDREDQQQPVVALAELALGRTHVVSDSQRSATGERRCKHLGAGLVGAGRLARAHRGQRRLALAREGGRPAGGGGRGAVAAAVDRRRLELGVGTDQLARTLTVKALRSGLERLLSGVAVGAAELVPRLRGPDVNAHRGDKKHRETDLNSQARKQVSPEWRSG